MRDPGGPAMVMALLLLETAVGGAVVLFATPLWGVVRWGFFKLVGGVVAVCAVLGWFAARGSLLSEPTPTSASFAIWALGAFAAGSVIWQLALYAKYRSAARVLGYATSGIGVVGLIALGMDPALSGVRVLTLLQLGAGALFAGAVLDGLLLGHWHLIDRKLSRRPLWRMNQAFLIGCLAVVATILPTIGRPVEADPRVSPLLAAGDLVVWLAAGLAVLCLVIGVFIRALIKEDSIQSATGLFYLGVIMGFAAEFAAKVRFF